MTMTSTERSGFLANLTDNQVALYEQVNRASAEACTDFWSSSTQRMRQRPTNTTSPRQWAIRRLPIGTPKPPDTTRIAGRSK
jgi:hypothetical protein